MRKLTRPAEPATLAIARQNYNGTPSQDEAWKKFDKNEVRTKLKQAQNNLCAYCEVSLSSNTRIDHFKPKKLHYSLTFDWNNLTLSCDEIGSCDNKKGGNFESYWINPYLDDPNGKFEFFANGQIKGTSQDAQNIIKDFGLDCPNLESKRKSIFTTLQETILALIGEPEALEAYLESDYPMMFPTEYNQVIERTIGAK
ncbi:TIGR02646 family protein [Candidatus Sulfurimonas marisnigri]|uniref:TIGR02646 family protein n=1 Tax=Candidatus Sulfurimonas marisnigri TaxID=2740405 RepID=A0A7S7LYW4_9BACT|nr:retron system putative HNH endonuclease [Candidatus Sulfurimonas marisnigri]QOY54009.1 TIGR02646 family protein [Candidatus Sulfurimonas marisnigri]